MDEHSHTEPPSEPTLRIKALESLLVEKGLVDPGAVDELIELFEKRIGPRNGAKVVAHAWADPSYKKRLLDDGSKAIAELGPWPTMGLPRQAWRGAAQPRRLRLRRYPRARARRP